MQLLNCLSSVKDSTQSPNDGHLQNCNLINKKMREQENLGNIVLSAEWPLGE